MVTSASLLYVNEFVWERQDVGVLLLTHVSQEVQESLLQVSCLGVPQLIGQRADCKVHPFLKPLTHCL